MYKSILLTLLLLGSGNSLCDMRSVHAVVNTVMEHAKSNKMEVHRIESLFPKSLNAGDYEEIARQLKSNKFDLEQIGGNGVEFKVSAIEFAVGKLSEPPNGAASIIRLWEDKNLTWDGAGSLDLCNAALRRGKEMKHLLQRVSRGKDAADRCLAHIVKGDKTAY
jgi:hypothetical protein